MDLSLGFESSYTWPGLSAFYFLIPGRGLVGSSWLHRSNQLWPGDRVGTLKVTGPVCWDADDGGSSQKRGSWVKQSWPVLTLTDVNLCVSGCDHLRMLCSGGSFICSDVRVCVCQRERGTVSTRGGFLSILCFPSPRGRSCAMGQGHSGEQSRHCPCGDQPGRRVLHGVSHK